MKIGITGHQNLIDNSTSTWVYKSIANFIEEIGDEVMGLSSIAIGADQIFCQVLIDMSLPYHVIIPCQNYRELFEDKANYDKYINSSDKRIVLDYAEDSQQAFFDAGKVIVNSCDLVVAVWNGKSAKGLGGTGDVVNYARSINRPVYHINIVEKYALYL
ncbi:hypothetical protein [Lewinella sp. IMCC34191]|uniref:hypothetical protein n=1 Tax=Lewinella sp. IMCC34191 TaxID=2259172 RepID=UPI0013005F53|nr:hypothetical protein [Lewinella sp. IMCC34191]